MKDVVKFLGRRYSAVSTSENCNESPLVEGGKCEQPQRRRSLQSSRTVNFSILDSFFHRRQEGKQTRAPKSVFLLMAVGLLSIGTGVLLYFMQPYDLLFKWKLLFGEGGEIFGLWKTPPVDLYVKIYLFNITNSEEFLAGNEKIRVEEIGPYVYKELLSHENITFNDNGTLSSTPSHPLVFQEHLSEGRREDDLFMMPHIALLSIAQVVADKSFLIRLPINMVIRNTNSQPIVQQTAKEFMFGYKSKLSTLGNTLLPDWIYFDKVGLIDRMYDFEGDFETFYTGYTDVSTSGLYDTFRGSKDLPQWKGDHCSNIQNASDGTKFQSFLTENSTVKFFRKSMCRSQMMIPVGNETEVSGLNAQKYMFEENALDNGYYRDENKCYCRNGNCLPRGLIDVTDCYYGFPIALSYPHFLDADEKIMDDVDGNRPNRSEHESYFMINRESGLPLSCSVKFQINMAMRDVSNMAHVEQFSNMVIPMVWFEITMDELPQDLQNRFIMYLKLLPIFDKFGFYALLIGGALLLIIAVSQAASTLSKTTSSKKKISKNSKYLANIQSNGVYRQCEKTLIYDGDNVIHINDDGEDYLDGGDRVQEMKIIRRKSSTSEPAPSRYDLEDETAMSESGGDSDSMLSDEPSSSASSSSQVEAIVQAKRIKDNNSFDSASTSGISSKESSPNHHWVQLPDSRTSIDSLDQFGELRIVESRDNLNRHSLISTSSVDSVDSVTINMDYKK